MDRRKCQVLRKEIEELLAVMGEDIEKKHGVKLSLGRNGSYSQTQVTFKLEAAEVAADGSVQTKEAETFKALAPLYGLKPEDLGKTFAERGRTYKITGLNPKAPRFPIHAERDDGKGFKFPADVARRLR